jgi:hypothetical protein
MKAMRPEERYIHVRTISPPQSTLDCFQTAEKEKSCICRENFQRVKNILENSIFNTIQDGASNKAEAS